MLHDLVINDDLLATCLESEQSYVCRVGEFPEVMNLESFQESFQKVSGNIGSFVKLCQLHGMTLNVFLEMECNGVCDTDTDVVATLAL
jgi:hypothetical protein